MLDERSGWHRRCVNLYDIEVGVFGKGGVMKRTI